MVESFQQPLGINDESGIEASENDIKFEKTQQPEEIEEDEDKENRRGKIIRAVPVKLYISGRNLKDLDMFSKSDPVCIVFEKS